MTEQPKWMPSDESLTNLAHNTALWLVCMDSDALEELKETIRAAVEKATAYFETERLQAAWAELAQERARHAREIERARLEAKIDAFDSCWTYTTTSHGPDDIRLCVTVENVRQAVDELSAALAALTTSEPQTGGGRG